MEHKLSRKSFNVAAETKKVQISLLLETDKLMMYGAVGAFEPKTGCFDKADYHSTTSSPGGAEQHLPIGDFNDIIKVLAIEFHVQNVDGGSQFLRYSGPKPRRLVGLICGLGCTNPTQSTIKPARAKAGTIIATFLFYFILRQRWIRCVHYLTMRLSE